MQKVYFKKYKVAIKDDQSSFSRHSTHKNENFVKKFKDRICLYIYYIYMCIVYTVYVYIYIGGLMGDIYISQKVYGQLVLDLKQSWYIWRVN